MCGVFLAKASEWVRANGKWKKIESEWKSLLMDLKESAEEGERNVFELRQPGFV